MVDRNISIDELAKQTALSKVYISKVVNGEDDISPDMALKLEHALGIESTFWMNLKKNYCKEIERITFT